MRFNELSLQPISSQVKDIISILSWLIRKDVKRSLPTMKNATARERIAMKSQLKKIKVSEEALILSVL